jgi:hypothetical protein
VANKGATLPSPPIGMTLSLSPSLSFCLPSNSPQLLLPFLFSPLLFSSFSSLPANRQKTGKQNDYQQVRTQTQNGSDSSSTSTSIPKQT